VTEQQWEFCELGQDYQAKKGEGHLYSVYVSYYGPGYGSFCRLAEAGKDVWESSPFDEAMRLLGAAGWELVSHQYGSGGQWPGLDWSKRVAMFKRPVQEGRAVDEPKLIDIIKP